MPMKLTKVVREEHPDKWFGIYRGDDHSDELVCLVTGPYDFLAAQIAKHLENEQGACSYKFTVQEILMVGDR